MITLHISFANKGANILATIRFFYLDLVLIKSLILNLKEGGIGFLF